MNKIISEDNEFYIRIEELKTTNCLAHYIPNDAINTIKDYIKKITKISDNRKSFESFEYTYFLAKMGLILPATKYPIGHIFYSKY